MTRTSSVQHQTSNVETATKLDNLQTNALKMKELVHAKLMPTEHAMKNNRLPLLLLMHKVQMKNCLSVQSSVTVSTMKHEKNGNITVSSPSSSSL